MFLAFEIIAQRDGDMRTWSFALEREGDRIIWGEYDTPARLGLNDNDVIYALGIE